MKTAEQKVNDFLVAHVYEWNNKQERELVKLLKEQDRDTRHACAEAVLNIDELSDGGGVSKSAAHNACMNVRAV